MATAEELLSQMEENPELYADSVGPVSDVIVINAEERTIELPESEKIFGVESDKASERKHFKCPRIVGDNLDLSTFNLFINFKNANNEADIYPIDDVEVDGDYITFSWLLSKKVTAYKTDASKNQLLSFIFCAKNGEGPENEWNTTICSDGVVLEGLEPGESIAEDNPDIIQYILERLESAGTITPEQISGAVEEYFASNPIEETDPTVPAWAKEETPDKTLSEEGKAADAKEVGDRLSELSDDIANVGKPTNEQVSNAVNEYLDQNPVSALDASTAESNQVPTANGDGSWSWRKQQGGSNNSFIIDIEKYGIIQADFVSPFTSENYKIAYQNGVGIQNAINDAKANGASNVTLPSGNYPVCYSSDSDTTYNAIIDAQGINLIGYGVKLYVIYDEDGTNPYFTGETPRLLQGTIIKTDSDVRGFHLVGERAYRTNENTKYRESSYGIGLMPYTRGNVIKDCICELFSGDGIGCYRYIEQLANWNTEADMLFTSVDWDDRTASFVESTTKYTSISHSADWIDKTKPIILRCQSYFMYTTASLRILCFNGNNEYIGDVRFWQGEYFYFLPETATWYLQITREVEHATDSTESWGYAIGNGYYCNTTIDNCVVRFNQRGGISNLPTSSVIKNCEIHHNGCAYGNMVAFFDSTQFGIDIEDVYIHNISIEGCQIHNNLQGVLYRCWGIRFKDCNIYGYVNSLNSCVDFFAENTRFNWSCTMNSPTPFGSKVAIGCMFSGSKANEILDVSSSIIASTKVNADGIVNFLNANGEVLFNMDLTTLIYIAPELVSDGLEIGCDFTTLEAGVTAFDMQYGNATATARAGMIIDGGCVPVGNGNYVTVTDPDCDYSANEFTIEMFCLGFPNHAMRSVSGNIDIIASMSSVGANLIATMNDTFNVGVSIPYNGGKLSNMYFSNVLFEGVSTPSRLDRIPDLNTDKYFHIVIEGTSDGKVLGYINGYKNATDLSASDFTVWDTSDFAKFYLYGGNASETQILKHFNLYNRALTEDEVKKNLNYFKKIFGFEG